MGRVLVCLLGREPNESTASLQLKWIHTRSFGGDCPVCMQLGYKDPHTPRSYLDYDSLADAEADGAFFAAPRYPLVAESV